MIQIIVNGKDVKIDKNTVISYNLINFDITDLSNRKVDHTNSFKIPIAGNADIFEFMEHPSTFSNLAYDYFDITIRDGVFIMFENAKGQIIDIDEKYYNIVITKKHDALETMKSYMLSYEDVEVYDLTGGLSIFPILMNGTGLKYKADLIWSDYQTARIDRFSFDYRYMYLSRYVKHVLDKFTTDSGISFDGDLYSDNEFAKLRIVCESQLITETTVKAILSSTKTFYNLFVEILKIFGSTYSITGNVITINRFDARDFTDPIDFSGKITKIKKKAFSVDSMGKE